MTEKVAQPVSDIVTSGNGNGETISFPISLESKETLEEPKKVSSK